MRNKPFYQKGAPRLSYSICVTLIVYHKIKKISTIFQRKSGAGEKFQQSLCIVHCELCIKHTEFIIHNA